MSVFNRRNAVMGWMAWTVGKRVVKRKAKDAVPAIDTETKKPNKSAIALGLASAAAVVGAVVMWKTHSPEESE